ncbi:MAG: anti-sigma factor [Gemmatimonadaceae bacterium]|jgi:hypothetical protein|nr:anti-sigma factor [Gemmatimonadaceae bacterium]
MTTTPHDWYVEHRADFASRLLDEADEAAFRRHLATCSECRKAIDDASVALGWLSIGVAPVAPRPGFTQQIVRELTPPRGSGRGAWAPWLAAASAVVLLGGGWWRSARDVTAMRDAVAAMAAQSAQRDTQLVALNDTLSIVRRASRVLHAPVRMGTMTGSLTILDDPVSHRWRVFVTGLPPAAPGERYAFWFVCEDGMVRGADVTPQAVGGAQLTLGMPERGGRVMGAELTMERVQQTAATTTSMTLAKVMID